MLVYFSFTAELVVSLVKESISVFPDTEEVLKPEVRMSNCSGN